MGLLFHQNLRVNFSGKHFAGSLWNYQKSIKILYESDHLWDS